MSVFSRLARILFSSKTTERYLQFQVKCNRCHEVLTGRMDIFNDLSLEEEGGKTIYFCRKVLIGSGHCHQPVETIFTFDENRHVIGKKVTGGVLLDA